MSAITVETVHGRPAEEATAADLRELLERYDVSGWTWTRQVCIEERAISHSHPVLTLNTLRRDDSLLSVFLHEQLHWWLDAHPNKAVALAATNTVWPDVPPTDQTGTMSDDSTREHLILCFLEDHALTSFVGDDRARAELERQMGRRGIYPWNRRQVATHRQELSDLCTRYELWPPAAAPAAN